MKVWIAKDPNRYMDMLCFVDKPLKSKEGFWYGNFVGFLGRKVLQADLSKEEYWKIVKDIKDEPIQADVSFCAFSVKLTKEPAEDRGNSPSVLRP